MMNYWGWHTEKSLLLPDEVLLHSQTGVALYDGEKKTDWKQGKAIVTTHRVLYQDLSKGSADGTLLQLPLETLHKSGVAPTVTNGFAFSSDKIVLPLPASQYTRISFRSGGAKECHTALLRALEAKAWRTTPAAASPSPATQSTRVGAGAAAAARPAADAQPAPRMVGIAGIMQASAERSQMQETFRDVDDVMAKASSLVANIRQLKDRAKASDRTGGPGSSAEDQLAIESIEATLGLGTMVTASSSSSGGGGARGGQKHFHEELAAELHAWMTHPRTEKVFGRMPIVPLVELFSMYNRARSGDLVAPDDVLQACKAMSKQTYSSYTLKTLASGRLALIHKDTTIVLAVLVDLMGPMLAPKKTATGDRTGGPPQGLKTIPTVDQLPRSAAALRSTNEVEVANTLRVALPVAKDVLEDLATRGYLCECDSGYGCSNYYWNIFVF